MLEKFKHCKITFKIKPEITEKQNEQKLLGNK
jgi:hypothetical protein